jgi:LCP family protein required for cell wall assembly
MTFEHLDNPAVGELDLDRLRAGVTQRAGTIRRRRRFLRASGSMAVVVPLVAGAVLWQSIQPTRIHVLGNPPSTIAAEASTTNMTDPTATSTASAAVSGAAVTILVVGSDRGLSGGGAQADTLLVIRLDPAGARRVLALPRDLRVTDPRNGQSTNMRGLLSDRATLVQTVTDLIGTKIDHYVEADAATFALAADATGGVRVPFAYPVRDAHSGFEAGPGCSLLNGAQLRAYARSRYFEWYEGGAWHADEFGDLSRVARMGDLVTRVVTQAVDATSVNLDDLLLRVFPRLTVDDQLTTAEMGRILRLARDLRNIPLHWSTVPTHADEAGEMLIGDAAPPVVADYVTNGAPLPLPTHLSLTAGTPEPSGSILPTAGPCGP